MEQVWQIISFLVPLALFFVVVYFFIMRPEKKRRMQIYEMQSQLQLNDKIVTIGGIHGIIDEIKDDTVTIILVGGGKMKIEKAAIRQVITE